MVAGTGFGALACGALLLLVSWLVAAASGFTRLDAPESPPSTPLPQTADQGLRVAWGTYLGAEDYETAYSVAVGPAGCVFIAGETSSPAFPTTPGAYRRTFVGDSEMFVAKLSADGDSLLWSTFIGGSRTERATDIEIAPDGGVLVCGGTHSPDFPFTHDSQAVIDMGDAVVLKLSPDGRYLHFSRVLGGSNWDMAYAVTVDSTGDVYVVGETFSAEFPVTPGAYRTSPDLVDSFAAKIHGAGDYVAWSSFLGHGIAKDAVLDEQRQLVVVGLGGATFPTTPGAYCTQPQGSFDGFALKLLSNGTNVLWCTLLGGLGYDGACAASLMRDGRVAVLSFTESSDFPTTANSFDGTYNGGPSDMAVSMISSDGTTLLWSTFVGGDNEDAIADFALWPRITVDSGDCLWLAGQARSSNYPVTSGAISDEHNGSWDVVVTRFSQQGVLAYSSYIGTVRAEGAKGIAAYGQMIVLCGRTLGSMEDGFPVTAGAYDSSFGGASDAFVLKLRPDAVPLYLLDMSTTRTGGRAILRWRVQGDAPAGVAVWLGADGRRELRGAATSERDQWWRFTDPNPPAIECEYWLEVPDEHQWFGPYVLAAAARPSAMELAVLGDNQEGCAIALEIRLPLPARVDLALYDLRGRRVAALPGGALPAGNWRRCWDGRGSQGRPVAAGVYTARMVADGRVCSAKVMVSW